MKAAVQRRISVLVVCVSVLVATLPGVALARRPAKLSMSISDVSQVEGDSATSPFRFTVRLNQATSTVVSVKYATAASTATAGVDYTTVTGSLSFAPGATQKTMDIPVKGDLVIEANETFFVNLSGAGKTAKILDPQGLGTIVNDDKGPGISIADATFAEGESVHTGSFDVSLSHASSSPVTVAYATANGTASAGSDYSSSSGTITFAPGDTFEWVPIDLVGDQVDEPEEDFTVSLSNSSANAWVSADQATGRITDDDAAPRVTVNDVIVTEPIAGDGSAAFSVSLSSVSGKAVTVGYTTADATTDPATAGADYASASGQLTFDPGQRRQEIDVVVHGDAVDEPDEKFNVTLADPVEAVPSSKMTGTATIVDDDPTPVMAIGPAEVEEHNAGQTQTLVPVTLSAPVGQAVTATYSTSDGSAKAGSDYEAGSGTITFAAGSRTQEIAINVNGDAIDEPNESFSVDLSGVGGGAVLESGSATVTIIDDDKDVTHTTAAITKKPRRVRVRGRVVPAAPGQRMVVKFYKKQAGRWSLLRTKRPSLSITRIGSAGATYSAFNSRFWRPRKARHLKVVAIYSGDATHVGSKVIKRF